MCEMSCNVLEGSNKREHVYLGENDCIAEIIGNVQFIVDAKI